jgi:hypothetical protein
VVVLRRTASGGKLEGSVEEVDSGKQAKFRSEDELIGFLREQFSQTLQCDLQNGGNE